MSSDELIKKDQKVLILHLIYWAVIFVLLTVFLLCIAPGRVNDSAFENFSFASILVSIVLAVVSIVYSFRSKSSASENIAGIREIENNIDKKLLKFDSLQESITTDIQTAISEGIGKAISDLQADVGNILEDQADIKQNVKRIALDQKKLFEADSDNAIRHKQGKSIFKNGVSFIGKVAMYLASISAETAKAISFPSIGDFMNSDLDYYWGYYSALASCFPEYFSYDSIKERSFSITKYDNQSLGNSGYWKKAIEDYDDKESVNRYLSAIEGYFNTK